MDHTVAEFLSELPLHLALFACGAIGWSATKWATRRFSTPRKPPVSLSSKLGKADWQDDVDSASLGTSAPCASSAGPSPAQQPVKRLSSGARRRASRRAVAAAGAAVSETAVDVADETTRAEKDGCKLADPANLNDFATSTTTGDASSQNEEPEPEARRASSLDQLVADDSGDVGAELPTAMAAVEPSIVSDRVARLMAKKAERKARKAQKAAAALLEQRPEPQPVQKKEGGQEEHVTSPIAAIADDTSTSEEATQELLAKMEGAFTVTPPMGAAGSAADVELLGGVQVEDAHDAQPVETTVGKRVAKAEEPSSREQLAAAAAKEAEDACQKEEGGGAQCQEEEESPVEVEAEEEEEEEEEDKVDKKGAEWWVDIVEDAPLDSDLEEPDEEPAFRGAATWSGPRSTSEWLDLEEASADRRWSSSWSRPAGRQRAWTQPVPSQAEDEWMVPLEEMVGPSHERTVEGCESAVAQASDPNIQVYQPVISEDGQQLYTDGQQVYMMAAMTVDTGAPVDEAPAPQVITPVVDPCDPLHQTFMGLSAAVAMGCSPPDSVEASRSWLAHPRDAFDYGTDYEVGRRTMEEDFDDDEDILWGVCWDFAK